MPTVTFSVNSYHHLPLQLQVLHDTPDSLHHHTRPFIIVHRDLFKVNLTPHLNQKVSLQPRCLRGMCHLPKVSFFPPSCTSPPRHHLGSPLSDPSLPFPPINRHTHTYTHTHFPSYLKACSYFPLSSYCLSIGSYWKLSWTITFSSFSPGAGRFIFQLLLVPRVME